MLRSKKKKPTIDSIEQDVVKEFKKESKLLKKLLSKNEDHLLFTGFVMIMTAVVVIATISVINDSSLISNRQSNVYIESSPSNVLKSSETAQTSTFSVSIKDVYEKADKDPAFTISDDETFLIFTMTLTNNTTGEQDLYPVKQLYVRSKDGDFYTMHITSFITEALPAMTLKPNESVSGQVSFAIPKALADPLFYVDLGWNDVVPIVYDVLR